MPSVDGDHLLFGLHTTPAPRTNLKWYFYEMNSCHPSRPVHPFNFPFSFFRPFLVLFRLFCFRSTEMTGRHLNSEG